MWGYNIFLAHLLNIISSVYEPKYYCYNFLCYNFPLTSQSTEHTSPCLGIRGYVAGKGEIASCWEKEEGGAKACGEAASKVSEHPVILVNLGTILHLNPFLITSSESRDMLVTGVRRETKPQHKQLFLLVLNIP